MNCPSCGSANPESKRFLRRLRRAAAALLCRVRSREPTQQNVLRRLRCFSVGT